MNADSSTLTFKRLLNNVAWLLFGAVACYGYQQFLLVGRASQSMSELSRVEDVSRAVSLYMSDNEGFLPNTPNSEETTQKLMRNLKEKAKSMPRFAGIVWNPKLTGKRFGQLKNADETWCFYIKEPDYQNGYFVGFADGDSERVSSQTLRRLVTSAL